MATPETDQDEQVQEADRRNGEPDATDPRISNLRGYTIVDVDINTINPILMDPATQFKALGSKVVNGRQSDGVEIRSARLLKGIDHEQIWFDEKSHFPTLREMYDATRAVYRVAFSEYNFNPSIPAATFAKF